MPRQTSFASGQLDHRLLGRTELVQYANGLRGCRNTIVLPSGALANRPGTEVVAIGHAPDYPVRVVPFDYARGQNYALEVGRFYIRIIKNGEAFWNAGFPVVVETGFGDTDLWQLTFSQVGDIVTITNTAAGSIWELRRNSETSWSLVRPAFFLPCPTNTRAPLLYEAVSQSTADSTHPPVGFQWAYTLVDHKGRETLPTPCLFPPATSNRRTDQKCVRYKDKDSIELLCYMPKGYAQVRVYGGNNGVLGFLGYASESVPPYPGSLEYVPNARKMYFEDVGEPPDFSQMPPKIGHDPFYVYARLPFSRYEIGDMVSDGVGMYVAVSPGTTGLPGEGPTGTEETIEDGTWSAWETEHAYVLDDYVESYGGVWQCVVAGTSGTGVGPSGEGRAVIEGTCTWRWVCRSKPVIWSYVGAYATAYLAPYCSTVFRQRRVFGGGDGNPSRLRMTKAGNYYDFDQRGLNLADNDPIDITLATEQREEIRHMRSHRTLLVLTSQGIWSVSAGNDSKLTPTSPDAHRYLKIGASWLPPEIVGTLLMFVTSTDNDIHVVDYQALIQSVEGGSLTDLARDLFEGYKIVSWCYQRKPYSILWCVRDDGKLLGVTFNQQHKITAWHWHDTAGTDVYESVCAVEEGTEHAVYAVVRRTVGGTAQRVIERFASRLLPKLSSGVVDHSKGVFLDSSVTFEDVAEGAASFTIEHLAGRTVYALVDGFVLGPYTVGSGGELDLSEDWPDAAGRVTVGLLYEPEVQLLPAFDPNKDVRTKAKRLHKVEVEVVDTLGLSFGPTFDNMRDSPDDFTADGGLLPYTGVTEVALPGGYSANDTLCIKQKLPLPFTLLAVDRVLDYED